MIVSDAEGKIYCEYDLPVVVPGSTAPIGSGTPSAGRAPEDAVRQLARGCPAWASSHVRVAEFAGALMRYRVRSGDRHDPDETSMMPTRRPVYRALAFRPLLTTGAAAAVLLATATPTAAQQLASCDFGEPNPAAPEETADFQFLVGNWRIAVVQPDGAGGWREPVAEAYWEGRYGLDGFAIVDYWYDGVPWETPTPPSRGVNTRMYDVQNELWQMVWLHTATPGVRRLQAKRRGDEVDMWQLNADGTRLETRRTWFHDIEPDSWVRTDERSTDGGVTWVKALRLEATRLPCPVPGAVGEE